MSNSQNEAALKRLMDMLTQPNVPSDSELSQLFTPDWYNNDQALETVVGHPIRGYDGVRELFNFWKPFTEARVKIEEIFSEGDWVACHFRITGRHTKEFMGMPPTGKTIDMTGTGMFRFQNGKISENIVNPDALGMLMQLGAVQMPSQRKAA
ncbi:MAG TPA: ester cyclase [Chloroflexota bacterium]